MFREYIDRIIGSNSSNKMSDLKDLLIRTIEDVREMNEDKYYEIEDELYEIVEGKVLTEYRAREIINNMLPYGMHWTIEDTEKIRKSRQFDDINAIDFWVVMNSAYNDYKELFNDDIDMYADFADLFINDEDAIDNKVYVYFTKIPR